MLHAAPASPRVHHHAPHLSDVLFTSAPFLEAKACCRTKLLGKGALRVQERPKEAQEFRFIETPAAILIKSFEETVSDLQAGRQGGREAGSAWGPIRDNKLALELRQGEGSCVNQQERDRCTSKRSVPMSLRQARARSWASKATGKGRRPR